MKIKKICAAVSALFVLSSGALGAPSLDEADVSRAKITANHMVRERKVSFAYYSSASSSASQKGGTKCRVSAWWLKPYCHVISEQLEQDRGDELDFTVLKRAGHTYQLRLMLEMTRYDKDAIRNSVIAVTQDGRDIPILSRRYTNLHHSLNGMRYKIGVVIDIDASEIGENEPISVTISGLVPDEEVTIKKLRNKGKYDEYSTKGHDSFGTKRLEFKWHPLHDEP